MQPREVAQVRPLMCMSQGALKVLRIEHAPLNTANTTTIRKYVCPQRALKGSHLYAERRLMHASAANSGRVRSHADVAKLISAGLAASGEDWMYGWVE